MHIFLVLIVIACVLMVLTVLAQSPKGGMAANFGVSNQVMGVRQTTDFLEKFTWGLALSIVVLCLAATMTMPHDSIEASRNSIDQSIIDAGAATQGNEGLTMPAATGTGAEAAVEGAAATPAADSAAQ